MTDYYTFDQWKKISYHVKRGEKATRRNEEGVPLFSRKQVERTVNQDPFYDYDYEGSMEEALGGWDWYK